MPHQTDQHLHAENVPLSHGAERPMNQQPILNTTSKVNLPCRFSVHLGDNVLWR